MTKPKQQGANILVPAPRSRFIPRKSVITNTAVQPRVDEPEKDF